MGTILLQHKLQQSHTWYGFSELQYSNVRPELSMYRSQSFRNSYFEISISSAYIAPQEIVN